VENTLFSGDDAGQYFYVTGFASATPVSSINVVNAMSGREVTAVKVDPTAANTIWLGASLNGNTPMVLKISGANTSAPTVQASGTIPVSVDAYLSSIDVDPANGSHLVATFSNYGVNSIWESTNGGTSWVSIEGNFPDVPVRWAVFAGPTAQLNGPTGGNGGILIATELGVWTTSVTNGAATQWIPNTSGLPNVRVDQIKYRNDGTVVAATHGRGLYTAIITGGGTSTGIPVVPNTRDFIRYVSATNNLLIVTGNLTIRTIDVQVFDMKGRLVYRSEKPYQNTTLSLSNLASGSYILKIFGNKKEQFTSQFIKR
ncbi:MAG: T9SS type A sorting domain-containing protein, partial [Chitinophagaceae bacterium]